jgi:hypothetical protein
MNTSTTDDITRRLAELHRLCPDMRFAQMLATLGLLGEDVADRSLWDLEDEEFIAAIERFRQDLMRRQPVTA